MLKLTHYILVPSGSIYVHTKYCKINTFLSCRSLISKIIFLGETL